MFLLPAHVAPDVTHPLPPIWVKHICGMSASYNKKQLNCSTLRVLSKFWMFKKVLFSLELYKFRIKGGSVCLAGTEIEWKRRLSKHVHCQNESALIWADREEGVTPSLPLGLLPGAQRHVGNAFCDGRLFPLLLYWINAWCLLPSNTLSRFYPEAGSLHTTHLVWYCSKYFYRCGQHGSVFKHWEQSPWRFPTVAHAVPEI